MSDRLAVVGVHAVAAVGCFFAGWFVQTQGPPTIPLRDEWRLISDRVNAPDFRTWCLGHMHEHRYPLGKAVWAAAVELDGGRFRLARLITVGLLTAASVLFLWTARGVRGRAHLADAAFPILLLNFGHAFNLLMSFQLTFALIAYGLAGWLWAANRVARGGGVGWAVLVGLLGAVVVQSGGFGLLFTLPLAGWALVTAWKSWPVRWAVGGTLAGFALLWLAYSAWIIGTAPASPPKPTSLGQFASAVGGYFSFGFGTWPLSPHFGPGLVGMLAAGLLLAGAGLALIRGTWNGGKGALAAVLLGGGLVAAATAYARGDGRLPWYVTPSAAVLATAWLAIAARPAAGWLTGAVGVAMAAGVYWVNVEPGRRDGYLARCVGHEMQADIDAGVAPVFLAGRYGGNLQIFHWDTTADFLKCCQRYGLAGFRNLATDPKFRVAAVSGLAVPFAFDCPEAEFLASPRTVPLPDPPAGALGVRFRVRSTVPAGWHVVRLRWRDGPAERSAVAYAPALGTTGFHLTFPLSGRPTGVRLVADSIVQPFTVEAVEWMIGE